MNGRMDRVQCIIETAVYFVQDNIQDVLTQQAEVLANGVKG